MNNLKKEHIWVKSYFPRLKEDAHLKKFVKEMLNASALSRVWVFVTNELFVERKIKEYNLLNKAKEYGYAENMGPIQACIMIQKIDEEINKYSKIELERIIDELRRIIE